MEGVKKVLVISGDKSLNDVLYFCLDGWGYEVLVEENPSIDLLTVKKRGPDVIIIDVHSARHGDLEICKSLKEDFITASIPIIILINKRQLRMHLLSLKQGIDDYLIKPPDPLDLRVRIEMALRRTQYSFYTNSLTGLAGGRIIEEMLRDKIEKRTIFSFAHLDIDHFKYFNDRYGYIKGDRVIMQTAYILYNTVKRLGNRDDFVGHIGGDDFVFLTTPDKEREISSEFIRQFLRLIPFHYSDEDRVKGYIIAQDRSGREKKIPLMTISISIVNNLNGEFQNIVQINESIAAIKAYLKKIPGNKFMVERRVKSKPSSVLKRKRVEKNKKYPSPYIFGEEPDKSADKPLGQRLLEKGLISAQQLEEALTIHWRRGLVLGEVLKEMGYVKDEVV